MSTEAYTECSGYEHNCLINEHIKSIEDMDTLNDECLDDMFLSDYSEPELCSWEEIYAAYGVSLE